MFYVAEELREIMSQLGFRTIQEMVGRVDKLRVRTDVDHWKASRLDFSDVLMRADARPEVGVFKQKEQEHGLERALDNELIELCKPALERREKVVVELPIRNVHRTVGTMLAGEVARRFGKRGLPPETITLRFTGSAGQSFGAFMTEGMCLELEGDANDYVGKGMAGGVLAVRPPRGATFRTDKNILIGNTVLYGATAGKAFFNGRAGERFCVRNSGATAVVEGVGDHGCEYMTGGRVLVLGTTGRNFAAGMSGGIAYVLDEQGRFDKLCNTGMVDIEALSTEDAALVAELIEEHIALTDSRKAMELLERWDETIARFVKVMPHEYRRVLEEQARRREEEERRRGLPLLDPNAEPIPEQTAAAEAE
jgi:glutamate synthase domain-containing protein 3